MAYNSPLLHDGTLLLGFDARNSTFTGTTQAGPNGSGQFLAVKISTTADFTVGLPTSTAATRIYGILQNKGSTGQVADVAVFGNTKAVAGGTITRGDNLMVSSTAVGSLITYSSAALTYPMAIARESAVVGQVFSVALYGFGAGAPGTS